MQLDAAECVSSRELLGVRLPHLGLEIWGRYGEIWICLPHLGSDSAVGVANERARRAPARVDSVAEDSAEGGGAGAGAATPLLLVLPPQTHLLRGLGWGLGECLGSVSGVSFKCL